jgi:hypothetical protein
MRESINGHLQNDMRRVHVLIDASPCEREAVGYRATGASSPNCEMRYTSQPGSFLRF